MLSLTLAVSLLLITVLIAGGYILWLLTAPRRVPRSVVPDSWPAVLIVVPVYDEAPLIERKLANLAALTYPDGKRRVVVVDGGSTDGTVQCVSRWMSGRAGFDLLQTTHRNKTAQLNEAVRAFEGPQWILVTDADALLTADVLARLVAVAAGDPSVGVVGTRVRPASAHVLEALHWRLTEWLREREYCRATSGIVAAPCYLAHRQFLADLPPDTLADDVHVACRAMLAGRRVGHTDATVLELRSPRRHTSLLRHKYRKVDAYLREVFRFLPRAWKIPLPMRLVFLWRAALLLVAPPLVALAGTCGLVAIAGVASMPRTGAVAALTLGMLAPLSVRSGRQVARVIWLAAVLSAVTVTALGRYPFSRQAGSFPKVLQPWEYQLPEDLP